MLQRIESVNNGLNATRRNMSLAYPLNFRIGNVYQIFVIVKMGQPVSIVYNTKLFHVKLVAPILDTMNYSNNAKCVSSQKNTIMKII